MIHKDSTGKPTASLPASMRGPLDLTKLRLINQDSIIFVFVDELEDSFTHSSGIEIARTLSTSKQRWAKVIKVHPSVQGVSEGDYIIPFKLWKDNPFGAVWDGWELWMCSSHDILLVTKDRALTEVI